MTIDKNYLQGEIVRLTAERDGLHRQATEHVVAVNRQIEQIAAERDKYLAQTNQTLADLGSKVELARQMLEQVTAEQPTNGAINEEMARVLHE